MNFWQKCTNFVFIIARMVFEQDFASPHSTNENNDFMEQNFPNHTPTLHRLRHTHPFWFPPKMDDFWPIERVWAIMAQRVFRSPRPKTIAAVMRRVREECRSFDEKTLTKLIHELPAKMNEIRRLKGKKIPANFDPSKSPFACKCSICASWFDNFQAPYPQPPTKTNKQKPHVPVAQG